MATPSVTRESLPTHDNHAPTLYLILAQHNDDPTEHAALTGAFTHEHLPLNPSGVTKLAYDATRALALLLTGLTDPEGEASESKRRALASIVVDIMAIATTIAAADFVKFGHESPGTEQTGFTYRDRA